jgi:hypothetical protein
MVTAIYTSDTPSRTNGRSPGGGGYGPPEQGVLPGRVTIRPSGTGSLKASDANPDDWSDEWLEERPGGSALTSRAPLRRPRKGHRAQRYRPGVARGSRLERELLLTAPPMIRRGLLA